MYDDTIAAIATPPGEGGIGIVRLSGPQAVAIAQKVFQPKKPGPLRSHHVRYGHIVDSKGKIVDEALTTLMRSPHSFTREDVVEFACHGGPLPVQLILELVLAAGARLANPGEFTLRAFLNGRLDLSQAEAVLDIIHAQTATGLALAEAQLSGWLAQTVGRIRADLLNALAYVTVTLDFPEDEVAVEDIGPNLTANLAAVEQLLATAAQGMVYRQGARAVLVGRPNVGKSSLLNALLRANRAIVTPVPGTTRDTLEETANLAGIPVVLIDTAGITASSDLVEQLGIERSRAALLSADLALLVLENHQEISAADAEIAQLTFAKPTLLIWNKVDTSAKIEPPTLPFTHPRLVGTVQTSAHTGAGIDNLVQTIAKTLVGDQRVVASAAHLVTNPRHRDALQRATASLQAAVESQNLALPPEFLASDLLIALNALGELTGETVGEDLLETIFSRFCLGK